MTSLHLLPHFSRLGTVSFDDSTPDVWLLATATIAALATFAVQRAGLGTTGVVLSSLAAALPIVLAAAHALDNATADAHVVPIGAQLFIDFGHTLSREGRGPWWLMMAPAIPLALFAGARAQQQRERATTVAFAALVTAVALHALLPTAGLFVAPLLIAVAGAALTRSQADGRGHENGDAMSSTPLPAGGI